jgi:hypothetical protein
MLLLYRGFIGSVLEYGSVCYAGMARTHMLLLERIQYRALGISMGLMGATPKPEVGYTRHELGAILSTPRVNRHMEVALSGVHADMYPIVAPLK